MADSNLNVPVIIQATRLDTSILPRNIFSQSYLLYVINQGADVGAIAGKANQAGQGAYDAQVKNDEQDVELADHDARITANTKAINLLEVRLTTAEGKIVVLRSDVDYLLDEVIDIQAHLVTVDKRLDSVESDVSDIKSDYVSKTVIMATWQGSNGGLLAGIGGVNSNAPSVNDIGNTLQLIRQNNDIERSGANNVGLTALQGLSGIAGVFQQEKQAQRQKEFQQAYANAYASGDRGALRQLATQYPDQIESVRKGMGFIDEDQRNSIGTLAAGARLASSSPEAMQSWLQNNTKELTRVGVDPNSVAQMYQQNPSGFGEFVDHLGMAALGPIDYFNVQDKMAGREIDRGRLAETIRSNQAGEALQARGQNLSYQSAMTGHNIAAQRLALDQQEFGFKMQQAQEKAQQLISEAPKLSVNMEKGIETAVNNATASSNSANSMSALAQQFRAEKPTTGLFGNAQNMFAKLTGSDTTLRDLRIRQNALVNSQVLKFLPPGPATDKDVEIVRQGAPTDMDNPETVARWLDAMANLERRNAQFNEFKAEWMSANGNPGQSRNGGQILGLDVKKGESLGSAVKRYMSMNTDAAPAQDSTPSGEPRNQVGSYTSKSGIQFTVE